MIVGLGSNVLLIWYGFVYYNYLHRIPLYRLPNRDLHHPVEQINDLRSGLQKKYIALSLKEAFEPLTNDHDVSDL